MINAVLKDTIFNVETRKEAIEVLAQGARVALHEHATNPLIYHAASELIVRDDRGQKTDIRALGLPHQVLAEVANELHEIGISAFASSQIVDALEGYAIGLGADFAREAQAKPLYARIIVTDKKPDDIPDCELVQATLIDGQRRLGEGVSQRVMQSTIYGTRTSMTKEMNLDEMFAASRKKWLLIYYGSPSNETYKGLDSVDVSLINLMQGLGDKLPENVMEDIQEELKAGTLSHTQIDIIEEFAGIEKLLEAYSTQETLPADIQSELSVLIAGLSDKIAIVENNADHFRKALSLIIQNHNTGLAFPAASNDEYFVTPEMDEILIVLESISQSEGLSLDTQKKLIELLTDIKKEAKETGEVSNASLDKIVSVLVKTASVEDVPLPLFQSISALLPEIARIREQRENISAIPHSEIIGLVELVQVISQHVKKQQEAGQIVPVLITDSLDIINNMTEGQSSEKIIKLYTDAIKNSKSDQFVVAVQDLVVSLAQPDIQVFKAIAPDLAFKHAEIIQVATTSMLIRTAEAQLNGIGSVEHVNPFITVPVMERAELKQLIQALKVQGLEGLMRDVAQGQAVGIPKDIMERVLEKNPTMAEISLTAAIQRDLQSRLIGRDANASLPILNVALEPADIKAALQILKSEGISGLFKKDPDMPMPATIREAVEQMGRSHPQIMEAVLTGTIIREIEGKMSGGVSKNVASIGLTSNPRELNHILELVKAEGVSVLLHPQDQSLMSPHAKQAVEQFVQKNPAVMETIAAIAMIREIERAGPSHHQIPAEEKSLIVHAIQTGGLKALTELNVSEKMMAHTKVYVANLVAEAFGKPEGRMEPPIIGAIRKAYTTDNSISSHAQFVQNGLHKPLSSAFNTDNAHHDYNIASTLSKVLSQPSQGISAKDYERNLKILDWVNSAVWVQSHESPKEAIAKLIQTPQGIAAADVILSLLNQQPMQDLSFHEQKSVMDIKKIVLETKIERDILENKHLSANIKADIVDSLHAAANSNKFSAANQSLDKVNEILQRAGAAIPAEVKELKNIVQQKVEIQKEQVKPISSTGFTHLNAFTQEKVIPQPEQDISRRHEESNRPSAKGMENEDLKGGGKSQFDFPSHYEQRKDVTSSPAKEETGENEPWKKFKEKLNSLFGKTICPMGNSDCCCSKSFKKAANDRGDGELGSNNFDNLFDGATVSPK